MLALSNQRRIHDPALPIGPTPNDREIFLLKLLPLHQQAKASRRRRCLGHKHQPAGLSVKPGNYRNLAAAGDLKGEKFAKLFPQSWPIVGFGRMNQQERRLIDDNVVIVLVNDSKLECRSNGVMDF